MGYIDLRFDTTSNCKEFIKFAKFIAFPYRFSGCCNRKGTRIYTNYNFYYGTTTPMTNNPSVTQFLTRTAQPFTSSNLNKPVAGYINEFMQGYMGPGKSYIRNFPYNLNTFLTAQGLYGIYDEHIMQNNTLILARMLYSADTLLTNAMQIRPMTSYTKILYSAKTDIESIITFERSYERIGKPLLNTLDNGYTQQTIEYICPNTSYVINTLPESSIASYEFNIFDRCKLINPVLQAYTSKSTAVCNRFECENVANFDIYSTNHTFWEIRDSTKAEFESYNINYCEYTWKEVVKEFPFIQNYKCYPENICDEVITDFCNKIKNGKI